MLRCKVVFFMFSLIPIRSWQNFLIHSHIQKCELCLEWIASREEVKEVIFQQDDVKDYRELWPGIKSGILERKPGEKAGIPLYRKWGFAVSGILAILVVGFMFYTFLMEKGTRSEQEGEARFRINSIRVGDEPATPFVYQPKDSDMILVWVEKSL